MNSKVSPLLPIDPIEEAIFNTASELADPAARNAFLDRACGNDRALRQRIETLLSSDQEAEQFFADNPLNITPLPQRKVPATFPAAPEELKWEKVGRYKLLEKLGEGGCGVVYVAEQTEPVRRRVALKVIKLGMDTRSVIARFEAERQALAMMDHPNIAKVLDAGATEAGRPYFVMELVRGIRITDYCDENHLTTPKRLELLIKVCQAIQHAHQKGIIHRDIKPSNILVTLHDGVPVPKVIDFGIAKATEGRLTDGTIHTQLHQLIGTPAYMSPEQAEMSGLDVDTRSDIYSLGVLLYELLVGSTPFDSKDLMKAGIDGMRRTIQEKEPVRPSTRLATLKVEEFTTTAKRRSTDTSKLLHQLQGDLDWIVMKCLEKDRTRRYETANGVAGDLQRHLNNEPVLAAAPSTSYKVGKFILRNRAVVAVSAIVVGLLISGIAASMWLAIRATKAEQRAIKLIEEQARTNRKLEDQLAATERERLRGNSEKASAQHHLYVASMYLVQQAAEQNDWSRLRQLLEEMESYPDHGFEWFYWQRQLRLALRPLHGHLASVKAGGFSPDGTLIVTSSSDSTVKIWDRASAREKFTLSGHSARVGAVAWSHDGRWIVSGSDDHTAKIWEASTGRQVITLRTGGARVWAVAMTPDGKKAIAGCSDGLVRTWEVSTGVETLQFVAHRGGIKSLAVSSDGSRLATASVDGTARIWETATGRELTVCRGHTDWVVSVRFSPQGDQLVTASDDQSARVWEVKSGNELQRLIGHAFYVTDAAFSPDGTRIATSSIDRIIKIWDASSGEQLQSLKGHLEAIDFVAFAPDGEHLLSGGTEQSAIIWKLPSPTSPTASASVFIQQPAILALNYSPDGKRLVVTGSDGSAKVRETLAGRELLNLRGHTREVSWGEFSPDGRWIVTSGLDGSTRIWDAHDGRELIRVRCPEGRKNQAYFSPDSRRIVTTGDDTIYFWDAASGEELMKIQMHPKGLWPIAFSPDGQWIVGAGKSWDAQSGQLLATNWGDMVSSVAFSKDGRRMVTAGFNHHGRVLDSTSGRELFRLRHPGRVTSAAFSPDGRRILTANQAHGVVLADSNGEQQLMVFGAGKISQVVFSPDGNQIAGCGHEKAFLWTAAAPEDLAAWKKEEKKTLEEVARRQKEYSDRIRLARETRSAEAGSIKKWLVLAPIPAAKGSNHLSQEAFPTETVRHAREGEQVVVNGREITWKAASFEDSIINFNGFLGLENAWSSAYAVCYLHSSSDQQGLRLHVGTDDQGKVFLNGKEVYSSRFNRGFLLDEDVVEEIKLKAGVNVLVFKVVNETAEWKGSIRFTDAAGNPLKDLKVSLGP